MTRKAIIEKTVKAINLLPQAKAEEISVFADFLMKRHEEDKLTNGIQHLTSQSEAFEFLSNEEELYTTEDLKEIYNA